MSGRCYPVANKPEIIKEPVLVGDNDIDGNAAVIYGTVIKDSGRYSLDTTGLKSRYEVK